MKKGWTYKKLGECINKVPKQKQVKSKDYKSSGIFPIVSQEKDLISGFWNDESYLYRHEKAIIIFGDHTKEIKYIDFDFVVGADGTQILYPKDGIDTKFFYYALRATHLRDLGYARHFKLLKEKTFGIPQLSEQLRIVERLDSAFEHIDALKANAEKQLSEARVLFQKALERVMTPKKGGTYKKLGEICEVLNGLWKGKKPPYINVGVIRNANFTKEFTLRFDNVEYLDVELKQYEKRKLKKGDLIIEKSGGSDKQPVGRAVLFEKEDGNFSFSNFTSVLRMKDKSILSRFLYIYLLHIYLRGDTLTMQKATTGIHNIEFDKYLNIDVPIFDIKDQHRIVTRLDKLSENIKALEENQRKIVAECDAMKQAILRKVFE